jgi:ribose 5-phosphate isomerase A
MNDGAKRRAAEFAAEFVQDGQIVGLGTGSTASLAIERLARRSAEGLRIRGVPTSQATENLARELGIALVDINDIEKVDITIDGADEVDPYLNMIKGGGGALTREKLVAVASERRVYVVDHTKLVSRLGESFRVPVEVLPFAWSISAREIRKLGCEAELRMRPGSPLLTDNGNYILDCRFGAILDATLLESSIKRIPGVLDSGLFVGLADILIIGFEDFVEVRERG